MKLRELITPSYEIFCDLDGVLVNFDARFYEFAGEDCDSYEKTNGTKAFWKVIDDVGIKYWSEMNWMPEGKKLWNYISKYNPKLLSAPSRNQNSRIGKKKWTQLNLPETKLILAERENKQNYSGYNKILIDDNKTTINEWRANGGIGILFLSTTQTINELKVLGL